MKRQGEPVKAEGGATLSSVLNQLNRFLDLSEDWDGRGGLAPDIGTISKARAFLEKLSFDRIPLPECYAVGDGEVGLSWDTESGEVIAAFFEDGEIAIYGAWDSKPIRLSGDGIDLASELQDFLERSGCGYSAVRTAIRMLVKMDSREELAVDKATADSALAVLDMVKELKLPAPKIFSHGGDAIVFSWNNSTSDSFLTIDESYCNLLMRNGGRSENIREVIDLEDRAAMTTVLRTAGFISAA